MKLIRFTVLLLLLGTTRSLAQSRWFSPDDLNASNVLSLAVDAGGGIWAITYDASRYGLLYYDGGTWITLSDSAHGFPLDANVQLWDMVVRPASHDMVVATDQDVLIYDHEGTWSRVVYTDSLTERNHEHVFVDSENRTWITGHGRRIIRSDTAWNQDSTDFEVTKYDRPYDEIFQLRDGKLELLYRQLSYGSITNPAEDSKGNIWIAHQNYTGQGLLKYDGSGFVDLAPPAGCIAVTSWPSYLDVSPGDTLIVSSDRLTFFTDTSTVNYPATVTKIAPDLGSYTSATFDTTINNSSTVVMSAGRTYVGTSGGLFDITAFRDTTEADDRVDFRKVIPGFTPTSISVNDVVPQKGKLYCATSQGVVIYDPAWSPSSVSMAGGIGGTDAVMPNPVGRNATALASLEMRDGEKIAAAIVVDGMGRSIAAPTTTDEARAGVLTIETRSLAPGAYFLNVRTSLGRSRTLRFVVE